MTLEAAEVWAPGAPSGIALTPIALPGGMDPRVAMAAGASAGLTAARAEIHDDGMLHIGLSAAAAGSIRFVSHFAVSDAVSLWCPGGGEGRGTLPPSWSEPRETRPLSGTPIGCLIGRRDVSLVGFAASAGLRPVQVRAGMIEESGEFLLEIHVEGAREAEVVIDLRGHGFADSVEALAGAIGFRRERAGVHDEQAVLCTWYSFHQDLVVEDLVEDARLAARLGIGTVIVDDGWQTTDAARGYGSCGDWQVEPRKIGDPHALVERLGELGLRTLWWVGTPFIGYRSQTFREGGIALGYHEEGLDAAVLDPRSPGARGVVVDRLQALLRDTGAHGFKLDFLERFARDGGDPPADADVASFEEGGLLLLDEIAALAADQPLMIEFREPYITPAALGRGTMFRVADCPLSPLQNRRGIVDMRLLSTDIAVHGDPIMWAAGDTPERVAQQFTASLFGVPQVSVRLSRLSEPHLEVVAHWLGFWRQHSGLLLHSRLRVEGVERDYAVVSASENEVTVTVRYGDGPVHVPGGICREWHVVNGGEDGVPVIGLDEWPAVRYEIYDARGRLVAEAPLALPVRANWLDVPAGGRLRAWSTAG